ncbi:MAG: ferrochelatase [Pseudomonadota bacterium]
MTAIAIDGAALDAWLDEEVGERASLCPGRREPTSFAALWPHLGLTPARAAAVYRQTERVVRAIAMHFPDNVFWDLDLIIQALADRPSVEAIEAMGERFVGLVDGFGIHSSIRFRYVHDFTYGFDWAKWVAKAPEQRAHIGPFDEVFLAYLECRRQELLVLIAKDDAKYGRLRDERPRNPFGFSREPQDERRLHEVLADRGQIPVATWDRRGRAQWGARFAEQRAELAVELGFAR